MQQADETNTNPPEAESTGKVETLTVPRIVPLALYESSCVIEQSIDVLDMMIDQLSDLSEWSDPIAKGRQLASMGRMMRDHLDRSLQQILLAEGSLAAGASA